MMMSFLGAHRAFWHI